jgi:hypothetical protein
MLNATPVIGVESGKLVPRFSAKRKQGGIALSVIGVRCAVRGRLIL